MKKYEYLVLRYGKPIEVDELNGLGAQGWHLSASLDLGVRDIRYTFARLLPAPDPAFTYELDGALYKGPADIDRVLSEIRIALREVSGVLAPDDYTHIAKNLIVRLKTMRALNVAQ